MRLPIFCRPPSALALAAALGLAACDGAQPSAGTTAAEGDVGGVLVIASPASPTAVAPTHTSSLQARQIVDLIYDPLVEIGAGLNTLGDEGFTPRLAERWSWAADSLSIAFHLDPDARWHDGRPVRAGDVRFTFDLVRDPLTGSSQASDLGAIDSVSTPDSLTAVVWFARRYPEQFYDAGGRLLIMPEHLWRDVPRDAVTSAPIAAEPIGSGPFRFSRAEPKTMIELGANTDYHLGRPKLDRVIIRAATDPAAATAQLFAGEIDFYEALAPEHLAALASSPDVVARTGPGMAYAFMAFNLRDPAAAARPHALFADRELRRALTMLVDRRTLAEGILDTLAAAALGPFPRGLPVADTSVRQIAYDPARGAALLDSLGWRDGDGDGVREREGQPLRFGLLVPTASAHRMKAAIILQEQLARGGVQVELQTREFQAFVTGLGERSFDAALGAWVLTDGSPSGLRSTWGSLGTEPGGQNQGSYLNPAFDAQVDSGLRATDAPARRRHFTRAFQTVVDDAPAIWLYDPKNAYGIHERFQTPPMRPTGWWLDVRHWWIPTEQRIARDQVGLPTTVAQR